jgi:hypothetical protein
MRRRWARLATAVGCWAMSQKRTCPVIMHSTQNRPSYAMQQSLVGRRRQLGATAATAAIQNLVTDDATMQRFKRPAACCRRCGRAASIIRNLSSTPLAHAHALIMAENLTQHRAGKALLALLQAQKGLADDVVQQITQLTAELLEEATGSGPAAGSELCGCAGGLVLAHAACVAAPPPPRDVAVGCAIVCLHAVYVLCRSGQGTGTAASSRRSGTASPASSGCAAARALLHQPQVRATAACAHARVPGRPPPCSWRRTIVRRHLVLTFAAHWPVQGQV